MVHKVAIIIAFLCVRFARVVTKLETLVAGHARASCLSAPAAPIWAFATARKVYNGTLSCVGIPSPPVVAVAASLSVWIYAANTVDTFKRFFVAWCLPAFRTRVILYAIALVRPAAITEWVNVIGPGIARHNGRITTVG